MRITLSVAIVLVGLVGLLCTCAVADQTTVWSQRPDMVGGLAYSSQINAPSVVADDWNLTDSGVSISALNWYGAYWNPYHSGDFSPNSDSLANAASGGIADFTITFWSTVPATTDIPFAHPGTEVWSYKATSFTETPAGATGKGRNVYQYHVDIPTDHQFGHTGGPLTPATYWLSIEANLEDNMGRPETSRQWGWLESANDAHKLSGAVENFKDSGWYTLNNNIYSSDMAFELIDTPNDLAPEPTALALVFGATGLLALTPRIRRKH